MIEFHWECIKDWGCLTGPTLYAILFCVNIELDKGISLAQRRFRQKSVSGFRAGFRSFPDPLENETLQAPNGGFGAKTTLNPPNWPGRASHPDN